MLMLSVFYAVSILLSIILLIAIMQNVIMKSVTNMDGIMLHVILLNVVAPRDHLNQLRDRKTNSLIDNNLKGDLTLSRSNNFEEAIKVWLFRFFARPSNFPLSSNDFLSVFLISWPSHSTYYGLINNQEKRGKLMNKCKWKQNLFFRHLAGRGFLSYSIVGSDNVLAFYRK